MSKLSNDLNKWIAHARRQGVRRRYDMSKQQNELLRAICQQHAKEIENILRDNNQTLVVRKSQKRTVTSSLTPQQRKLLVAYAIAGSEGLTNFEAGEAARLLHTCYWKRCSELRRKGYIASMDIERINPASGAKQMVNVITDDGKKALEND